MKAYIYTLEDPRSGEIRYVGWTVNPGRRRREHVGRARRGEDDTRKGRWVRKLDAGGVRPELVVIEAVPLEERESAEGRWIADLRSAGHRLTNMTDGGGGTPGFRHDPATVAKFAAKHRGFKFSDESRRRLSRARTGMKATPEQRRRMSEMRRGRKMPREAVEKTASAHRGRKRPPETCRKMVEAWVRRIHERDIYRINSDGSLLTKKCSICAQHLPAANYHHSSRLPFNVGTECKDCNHFRRRRGAPF